MTELKSDAITGKSTTGHEWDGIRELNTPLPRWWLLVLWATVIWAIGYWIVYPSFPTLSTYSKGVLGYNSRARLDEQMATAVAAQKEWVDRIASASVDSVSTDPDLLNFALAGGRAIFNENCAPCHAVGGAGRPGFPVLADDDWIWGGKLEDISTTIQHGIRSGDPDARVNEMPRFGTDQLLTGAQISDVADFVLSLSGQTGDPQAIDRGRSVFVENCAACHAETGIGNREMGAPNLTDAIWLYGSDKAAIVAQIERPRMGVMPAWSGRLDPVKIKMLSVYAHSLGGGE